MTDVVTDSETTMPEDTTAPDDEIVEPEKPVRIPPVLIAVMVVVLVIVICIVALRTRAARVRAGREELSRRAREARDSAGRTAAAKELDDRIMRLLSRLGYRPEPGEQIGAFAARVDEALGMKADSGFTGCRGRGSRGRVFGRRSGDGARRQLTLSTVSCATTPFAAQNHISVCGLSALCSPDV